MSSIPSLKFFTAGAIAVAVLAFPAFGKAAQNLAAQDHAVVTTEFSAAPDPKKKGGATQKPAVAKQGGGQQQFKKSSGGGNPQFKKNTGNQGGGTQQFKKSGGTQQFKQGGTQKNFVSPNQSGPKIITPNSGQSKIAKKVFVPKGANSKIVIMSKIRNAPARGAFRTTIRGRNYSLWRSGYRARYRGGWRTFVGLGALGVLAIGAYEYYPYAYVDAPADYCDGQTEDGCQMVFDEVPTEDGSSAGQCVAYCPQ